MRVAHGRLRVGVSRPVSRRDRPPRVRAAGAVNKGASVGATEVDGLLRFMRQHTGAAGSDALDAVWLDGYGLSLVASRPGTSPAPLEWVHACPRGAVRCIAVSSYAWMGTVWDSVAAPA